MSVLRRHRPVFAPLTDLERRAIVAIAPGNIRYPLDSRLRVFARELQQASELSAHQRTLLWQIVWSNRRQVSDQELRQAAQARCGWPNARDVEADADLRPEGLQAAPDEAPPHTDDDRPVSPWQEVG